MNSVTVTACRQDGRLRVVDKVEKFNHKHVHLRGFSHASHLTGYLTQLGLLISAIQTALSVILRLMFAKTTQNVTVPKKCDFCATYVEFLIIIYCKLNYSERCNRQDEKEDHPDQRMDWHHWMHWDEGVHRSTNIEDYAIRYDTSTCAESWVIIASLIYRLKPKKKIIRKRTKTSRRPYCHRNYHAMRGTCTESFHLHNLRATQWIERLKEIEHCCQTWGSCSKHFMVTVRVDSNYTLYNGNTNPDPNPNANLSARPAPFSSRILFTNDEGKPS